MRIRCKDLLAVLAMSSAVACASPMGFMDEEIPVVRFRRGPHSFTYYSGLEEPRRFVVRDSVRWRAAWATIWRRRSPLPPLPEVDFDREVVLVAALGMRPSGGYGILLDHAVQQNGHIEVTVRSSSPGRKCGVADVLTQPVDLARLPRTRQSIRFREQKEVKDCG
jgi:hypothetical protein